MPAGPERRRPALPSRAARAAALAALPGIVLLLGACGGPGDGGELPVLWDAPRFALTDRAGDTLRTSDLRGRTWVFHPFFINCRDVCPATTARMAALRDSLAGDRLLGGTITLVSLTVDPARDSTAALRRWAADHGAGPPGDWAFLRGTPPEEVRRLVQEGFRLSAMMPGDSVPDGGEGGYQVVHASRVLLVDARGRVRGAYEILRPGDFRRLLADVRRLARRAS